MEEDIEKQSKFPLSLQTNAIIYYKTALAAGMPGSHARIEIQWEILTQLPVCHSLFTKPRAKIAKGQQKM